MTDGQIVMVLLGILLQALPPAREIAIHIRARAASADVVQRTTART